MLIVPPMERRRFTPRLQHCLSLQSYPVISLFYTNLCQKNPSIHTLEDEGISYQWDNGDLSVKML